MPSFKKYFRSVLLFSILLTVLLFGTLKINDHMKFMAMNFFHWDLATSNKIFEVDLHPLEPQKSCIVFQLDPWDPIVMPFVYHPKGGLQCEVVQPFMTYVDYDGYLQLNSTEVNMIKKKHTFNNCSYQTFNHKEGTVDDDIQYDQSMILINATKLTSYNVDVKCFANNKEFYHNIHVHPIINNEMKFAAPTEDQLSVLMFMIDSVSFSAFQRNLPITFKYTRDAMGIKFFKGKKTR